MMRNWVFAIGIVMVVIGVIVASTTYESASYSFMIVGIIGVALIIVALALMLFDVWKK